MKHLKKSLLFLIFMMVFTTCKKDHLLDCLTSTGRTVTVNRQTGLFSRINMKDNVDVIIYTDTIPFIRVTAGEHLIDGIITELAGNTLYVRNENKCNWVRTFKNKYTVVLGMIRPEKVDCYGSGNFTCADTIRSDVFTFDSWNASGSANFLFNCGTTHINNNTGRMDYLAKGFSGVSFIYLNDTGIMDASGLETGYTYCRNSSTGEMKVYVTKELGVEIRYTGNIFYTGNPYRIDQQITGTGELIHN
jgi:hypothetical protein